MKRKPKQQEQELVNLYPNERASRIARSVTNEQYWKDSEKRANEPAYRSAVQEMLGVLGVPAPQAPEERERFNLRLPASMLQTLRLEAVKRRREISGMVEEAVACWLAKEKA